MSEMVQRIRFQGKEWILISGGAIATPEAYANFEPSYAHMTADGVIKRYHRVIGTRADIEFLGEEEVQGPTLSGLLENLYHPGWDGPPA